MEALHARAEREPNNPEAFYTIATYYWEKAYRDFTTSEADKMKFVAAGIEAIDKAIKLKSDYFEALTYKNLLLRVQANLEKNPARQQACSRKPTSSATGPTKCRRSSAPPAPASRLARFVGKGAVSYRKTALFVCQFVVRAESRRPFTDP